MIEQKYIRHIVYEQIHIWITWICRVLNVAFFNHFILSTAIKSLGPKSLLGNREYEKKTIGKKEPRREFHKR